MGDRPTKPNDKIPVATWNAMVDMLAWWKRTFAYGSNLRPPPVIVPTDTIRVRNDTGADRRAGEVIGVGASLLTPYVPGTLWFKGETPAATHNTFAVLLEPCPYHATEWKRTIARAQISGVCLAYVNFYASADRGAAPSPGNHTFFGSGGGGPFQILTPPTSTGEQLVPVLLGPMTEILTVLTPSSGIPARVGNTLTGYSCPVYYPIGTGLTRTLAAAGFNVDVFDSSNGATGGSRYVDTDIDRWGVRRVVVESCATEA